MLYLRNERLQIEIATPGTTYRGSRFDWSGFITQVTLDGKHTFCAPESLEKGEGSGGSGLCNEFGIFRPIGYQETPIGESFPKLGVGLLRRLDEGNYNFGQSFPIEPFPLEVHELPGAIEFQFEPISCRGFAARLRKTLRLQNDALFIEYELQNVGESFLETHEYVHNFLAIDGAPPSPEYLLKVSSGLDLRVQSPILQQQQDEIRWIATPTQAGICRTVKGNFQVQQPVWLLVHEPSGITVSETVNGPLERLTLWWASHVLSPEVFVTVFVQPGQTQRWTRKYEFGRNNTNETYYRACQ